MSFGGFGQNNQQQQSSGFGGFGSNNNNTSSGFGGSTLFGGSQTSTSGGFGSGGSGGFGSASTNTTPFGQNRPTFSAPATSTSGGGLFGGGTATAGASGGFGGFGNMSNNNNASGGGLFGASKPAFGSGTAGGLFGGSNAQNTGFGSTNNQQTSTFGAPISSALGNNNAECQGTGSTPFQAFTEKEGASSTSNHFQSISFMAPYKSFSFEELRLADYNQGRRFGNGSGQAGAFGQPNFGNSFSQQNTGGFGQPANNTGGGIFGQPATTSSSPFGASQPTQSGFGSGGGGIFGAPKPATSNLFGAASSSQSSGGLFGTAGGTGGGFGSGSNLFGNNNQQNNQQSKPFSFSNPTSTAGGFGTGGNAFGTNNTSNTGGGIFGSQTTTPFGQPQQQPAQSNPFGGFGQSNQNQNQTNNSPFGGFGQQQQQEQKPGGPFGNQANTNTGGGLFGNLGQSNNQQQPTTGGLFGNNANNQSSGSSLFAPKPANTGGGLFGNSTTNNSNTGGGLFSGFGNNNNNANQQQNQTGGLFGNTANQQQKPGGLFGNTTSNTGGGLFGNLGNNNNQQGGSNLFGGNNQQQQQSGDLFGNTNNQSSNLFGSQQQQQQPQQQQNAFAPPPTFNASLIDPGSAYGSASIFSGLPPPPVSVGPIATPINVKQKLKKSAILPHYKMSPNAASRLVTPQKRGFGFSYSTYGTPGSASSNVSTPGGLGSSLLFGSVGRGLGKSLSTSNLRRNFDSDGESILTPGAFSASSSRYGGTGSLKRLTIDRSLRTDLFGDRGTPAALPSPEKNDQSKQPGILKKKVSFDASAVGGNGENTNGIQVNGNNGMNNKDQNNSATPSAEEQGFLRTPSRGQGRLGASKLNGVTSQPEMEQVKGNELAIVHEDESHESSSAPAIRAPIQISREDQQPGAYWMKPSEKEIQNMTKEQLRHVSNYSVGREGCGYVEFNAPVDLTLTPLNEIFGTIVQVELRSLTVYPDQSKKPVLGKGLNVPSTIHLANSWPRQRDRKTPLHEKSGPRFNKHVDRLRKVGGTEFVRYEKDTGFWVFKVPHFTTYGFDYEDDASEAESLQTSMLSEAPPDTPTPKSRAVKTGRTPTATNSTQRSFASTQEPSYVSSSPDDTFQFRMQKMLPGAFDEEPLSDDDHEMQEVNNNDQSFLDERLAASPSDSGEDELSDMDDNSGEIEERPLVIDDADSDMEMEMAGAFPSMDADAADTRTMLRFGFGTPAKAAFNVNDDWAEALQRTFSPRKQDRQALRETQAYFLDDQDEQENTPAKPLLGKGSPKLDNHIQLMNSLWEKEGARQSGRNKKQATKGKGFKWPYSKKSKINDAEDDMDPKERSFHNSHKPSWGSNATLVYAIPGKVGISRSRSIQTNPILSYRIGAIVSEGRDVQFATLANAPNLIPETLIKQRAHTKVKLDHKVPMAKLEQTPFKDMASEVQPDTEYEKSAWELASILFDDQNPEDYGIPAAQKATYDHRIRKDRLIAFWEQLCDESARQAASAATTAEDRAIAHLSAHKVVAACDALVQGKDFRLATLVAQIGGDEIMREDMATQIDAWRDLNVLSEMTEQIRTLYSLLAGNTCVCEGKKGPLEDRAKTFVISERFDLDWKRAFGLRLYYSILTEEPIEAAVVTFYDDLQSDEPKKPVPWFIESCTKIPWDDKSPSQREDILWGLLKLYAASKSALPTPSIAETFAPHNTTGNPLDARLSFQLYHALTLRFPTVPDSAPFQADALAWTFATQLDAAGEWLWALYALLHLHSPQQRHMAIQSHLAHHAADIRTEPDDYNTLLEEFEIPPSWIWDAKALYARNVLRDPVSEVGYLVKAGDWNEAHEVLKKEVGPMAVIEEDCVMLRQILDAFKPGKEEIREWGLGGQVYEDYLTLLTKKMEGKKKRECLERLMGALPMMAKGGEDGFREMVAVQEISGVVGKEILAMKEKGIEGARVLQLPLTDDVYLKHTRELSLQYYKAVMAGGK